MVIAKVSKTVSVNGETIQIVQGIKYDESFEAYKRFPVYFQKIDDKQMLYGDASKVKGFTKVEKTEEKAEEKTEKKSTTRRTRKKQKTDKN